MTSHDIFSISVGSKKYSRVFTIRWYESDAMFRIQKRWLGEKRFAVDFGRLAFVFERYTQ